MDLSNLCAGGAWLAASASVWFISSAAIAQSPVSPDAKPPPPPARSSLAPPTPAADMQEVLAAQQALGGKPVETLTPAEARLQPSPADGVTQLMKTKGLPTAPDAAVTTQDMAYGADPMQKARIYKPAQAGTGPMPVVVYYHGGGWVIADLKTYDATPRLLAKQLGAVVVSVEYRHAPEHKFPAQHNDASSAYVWALKHVQEWGGDAGRVALAGESAGGNLAVATAIYARDNHLPAPLHVLAVYPIANASMTLPSRTEDANAKPLNSAMLPWFSYYYQKTPADARDPRLDLVKADLHGLPPTTIINAQFDPLRSDGETLAAAMRTAGDAVEQKTFPGVTHEFFGMGAVVKGASDAEAYAVARLKVALSMSR